MDEDQLVPVLLMKRLIAPSVARICTISVREDSWRTVRPSVRLISRRGNPVLALAVRRQDELLHRRLLVVRRELVLLAAGDLSSQLLHSWAHARRQGTSIDRA